MNHNKILKTYRQNVSEKQGDKDERLAESTDLRLSGEELQNLGTTANAPSYAAQQAGPEQMTPGPCWVPVLYNKG